MLRRLSATPCPIEDPQRPHPRPESRRDSIASNGSDTTANLEYTTEFKALFRNTKPRRRPTTVIKGNGTTLGFTIHEDEELKLEGAQRSPRQRPETATELPRRRSIISQPPQRPRHRVSFVSPAPNENIKTANSPPKPRIAAAPRRLSIQHNRSFSHDDTLPNIPSPTISKPARRGTIYIPNDDTTMPSVYMGIFSPLKSGLADTKEEVPQELTGLAAAMAKKRSARKSILAVSPKRGALAPRTEQFQATVSQQDRPGQGSGKENMPPGYISISSRPGSKAAKSSVVELAERQKDDISHRRTSSLFKPTASSMARAKNIESATNPSVKPTWNSKIRSSQPQPSIAPIDRNAQISITTDDSRHQPPAPRVPTKCVVPKLPLDPVSDPYPLLEDGIANASMYEESWLTQQEVAITQLVNNLVMTANPAFDEGHDHGLLRMKLLDFYSQPDMALLYRRLQGALLYGALKVSKGAIEGGRLHNDIGHRKIFINLWLKTYNPLVLRTALEVIVGRQVNDQADRGSDGSSQSNPRTVSRRTLHQAIETILVKNEDSEPEPEVTDTAQWSDQRTLLRSLMLIKLLDVVKTHREMPSTGNLFRSESIYKTSTSVVQQLMRLLNPSVGDAIRALHHLGYGVSHSQYPLEEYDYEIKNLAVDLRDGVRMTRLVELLLYRSASHLLEYTRDADATTTLAMPTGEVLSLTEGEHDWPLSQHLKLPCLGRATKVFNNQIALQALRGVSGIGTLLQDITAEDLVDGYREKTVRLLWGLTSKWGLGGLVDWDDLRSEIKRLGRVQGRAGDSMMDELEMDEEEPGYLRYKVMLKVWVRATASAHGFVVRNYTTSFADGRIFGAIMDEYEPYLTGIQVVHAGVDLAGRLKNIGCSAQFVRLFEKTPGHARDHIFDRDFVLASLAFLCSRLLGPSRRARAATAIQRGWRAHWRKVMEDRRTVLRGLATSCAALVRSKTEEERAKATILRYWRRFRGRKPGLGQSQSSIEAPLVEGSSERMMEEETKDEEDIWLSLR